MATLKYYAQKDALGYPIPGTMMATTGELPVDSIAIPSSDSFDEHPDGLRYYVRRDANGDIIPNSLFTSIKRPSGNVAEFTETEAAVLLTETGDTIVAENSDLIIL